MVEASPVPEWTAGWPAIVKPALQDASVGIDQASVVTSQVELESRVLYILKRFGSPILVEKFIPGREFLIHVIETGPDLGLTALSASEIVFETSPAGHWPIYTYTAKWHEGSEEYKAAKVVAPMHLPKELFEPAADIAKRAFRLLQCRDYARLDLRLQTDGQYFVLEVNPNPYLNSIALVRGVEGIGLTFEWLVVNLMLDAIARGGHPRPAGITIPANVIPPAYGV
jgi:D-alanine-D-alanine ligase